MNAGKPVLLVVAGRVVSHAAISRAAELAAGIPVTVVGVGRGDLEPEPPWADDDPEQVRRTVALAMSALESTGVAAKVRIATGPPARAIARVARSSGARAVILDQPGTAAAHWPGGFMTELRRRMHGSGVVVLTETDRRGGWMSA